MADIEHEKTVSRDEVADLLRRAGFGHERIEEIIAQLPDPLDLSRDRPLLESLGVTRNVLMDRFGASP